MKTIVFLSLSLCAWAADAHRGEAVVQEQGCLECHTVNAQGIGHEANATAPDLAETPAVAFTPAALASALWNHTPAMWSDVSARLSTRPVLTEADWQNVFAYLYSARVFDFPANGRHGQEVFAAKGCSDCHALTGKAKDAAPPLSAWKRVGDPAALAYQMWNHASSMNQAFAARKRDWPKLDGRDVMDLSAYVQYMQNAPPEHRLVLPDPASGRTAFMQNCAQCHQGPLALETRLANKTFLDIAAGVWNHVPLMRAFPALSETEMRQILAYVWELQYLGPKGNVTLGELAFASKHCAACHTDTATGAVVSPNPGKAFTPFSMAAAAWGPDREMHREMQSHWPALSPEDMTDLVAYLNHLSKR